MKVLLLGSMCLVATMVVAAKDKELDREKELKCDACVIIAAKLMEAITKAEKKERKLTEDVIAESVWDTCDMPWKGFGTTVKNGKERLVPGNQDNIWPRRLQDFCYTLLEELPNESILYDRYKMGEKAFEDFLCRGEGQNTACSVDNWGPWPGDDYDDYDHDEL